MKTASDRTSTSATLVRTARQHGGGEDDPCAEVRVGAGVADDLHLLSGETSVAGRTGLVSHDHRVAFRRGRERLLPVPDHAHRAAGAPGQQRQERLDGHVLLAAEPATHVGGDDSHLVGGKPEDAGDLHRMLDDLSGRTDGDDIVLDPRHPGLGLEVRVLDVLRDVLAFHHDIGASEAELGVAACDVPVHEHVAFVVNQRRLVLHRLQRIEHTGELVVVDHHQLRGVIGDLLRLRGDEGDRLTGVPNAVRSENGHLDRQLPEPAACPHDQTVVGHVVGHEDRRNSRQVACRGEIDRHDARRRHRRADDPAVKHPRRLMVGRVEHRALHLVDEVVVSVALPHDPTGGGAHDCISEHRSSPFRARQGRSRSRR